MFFLLFIPLTANAATCPAGRYLLQDECMICPETDEQGQGYYCPGDDQKHACPSPFTATRTDGVTSVEGCYIKLTQCVGGHVLPEPAYIGCTGNGGSHWDNRTCQLGLGDYITQRGHSITNGGGIYTRKTYANPTNDASGNLDFGWFFVHNEGYHLEMAPIFAEHPAPPSHPNIIYPKSFNIVCVPNSVPCNTFRNFTAYEDDGVTFNSSNPEHVAQFNTVFSAPPEDVEIGSITIHGTNCPVQSDIQNNAEWDVEQNKWDVHDCKCVNSTEHELSDRNCIGYGYQNADTSKDVFTIQENVIYDTAINDDDSYCIRCKLDTSTTKYFVADKDLYHEGYDSNTKKVSECQAAWASSPTPDYRRKGRYRVPLRPNYCNSTENWKNGTNAPGTELEANPCPRVACTAVGTTTSDLLPIKEASTPISQICVYGSETTICDTDGETCIPLQDVGSLPLSGWEMLP